MTHFSNPPKSSTCIAHSLSLISLLWLYLGKTTDYEASHFPLPTSLAFVSTKSNDPWNSELGMKLIPLWLFLQGGTAACGHLGVAFTNNLDRYTARDLYPFGSPEDHLDNLLPVLTYIPTWNCAATTVRLGGRVLICSLAKRLSWRRTIITINVFLLFTFSS
jgi:hypothetical protein